MPCDQQAPEKVFLTLKTDKDALNILPIQNINYLTQGGACENFDHS
jgi:hypothetical protein